VASKKKPTNVTSSTNNEELFQMATHAAKSGQKDGARVMFQQLIDRDKRNERAMMWMAKLAPTLKEREQWLERILKVNSMNDAAREALDKLRDQQERQQNRMVLKFLPIILILVVIIIGIVLLLIAIRP
jgi:TolA-binding protein